MAGPWYVGCSERSLFALFYRLRPAQSGQVFARVTTLDISLV